ncbi:HDIG domain-containing protein [Candidatus Roizmanbacteria bacterium]|nr:HDIG domain-containing protein [Candidatus Roizmanbacteria bacterium]
MITRKQAWEKLNELITNQNLIKHCLAVEAAMEAYAEYFDIPKEERETWRIAGLLHDADWEKYPDEHPRIIAQWLSQQHAPDAIVNAIQAHGFEFGIEPKTRMAQTLRAVDELTGLIVAVALVKGKKLENVTTNSVKNKWRDKTFARGVKREDIERGAEELAIPLDIHINIVLTALQKHAHVLGL